MRVVPFLVPAVAGALLAITPTLAHGQQNARNPPPPADVRPPQATPPPRTPAHIHSHVVVGEDAPDFELDGSRGTPVRLSRLRGNRVLLAFGDSHADLAPLRAAAAPLGTMDVRVTGVCGDKARSLEQAAAHDPASPLMLADVTGEVAALYGLWDFEHRAVRPGLVLIDRDGRIRMALLGQTLPADDVVRLVRFAVTGL